MKTFNDLNDELKPIVSAMPVFHPDAPVDPENFTPKYREPNPEVNREIVLIDAPIEKIQVKIYRPAAQKGERLPLAIWIHGGGYVAGEIDSDDVACEEFVLGARCIVITPEYHLAGEYPYPAALEDCYAALQWAHEHSSALGTDAERIAVVGGSAGGGLAAALCLLARDRGKYKICFQMPLYPMIDYRNMTASSHEITAENFPMLWNLEFNVMGWSAYLRDVDPEHVPDYASPAIAENLRGLPPAYICVGDLDMFRDETIQYVMRLSQADVPVEFHLYPGCYHAFESPYNETRIGNETRREYITALRRAFYKD